MEIVKILNLLKRLSLYIISTAVTVTAVFLAIKYLLPSFLPIIIALIVAAVIQKPIKFLHRKFRIPKKLSAALLVLLITAGICFGIYFLISRAYKEIVELSEGLKAFIDRIKTDESYAGELIDKIADVFPFWDIRPKLMDVWLNIDSNLESLLVGVAENLGSYVIPMLAGAVTFLPDALLFIVVTVFSAYYISVGGAKMRAGFLASLPEKVSAHFDNAYKAMKNTASNFLRAYLLIMAITFTELFVLFSAAKIPYAFLVALFTSIVDILPVLGTGTVLIPWSLFLLLTGNTRTGVILLVIYAVVTIVREFIEPRIVGSSVGISPFASLASMYVGLKLFGALGLFVCPLGVIAVQNLLKRSKN